MKKSIEINNVKYEINISEKNSKMGNIPSFSVPSGANFYCNQDCKGCYAKKGEHFRSCIKEANMKNYAFLEKVKTLWKYVDNTDYKKIIYDFSKIVNNLNCRIFRFNVYGDIDNNYMSFILDICNNFRCKDIKFYLYTKNYDIIRYNLHDIKNTKNLIVNISLMSYKKTYLIDRLKNIDNINFFYTYKDQTEIDILEESYKIKLHECLNDCYKNTTCIECGYCYNKGYDVCNKYRNVGSRKLDRSIYSIQNEQLDHYLKIFNKIAYKNVNNVFCENVLLYVTRVFNRFIDLDLQTLDLLVDNIKEVKAIVKKCDTFYLACCKTLLYIYNRLDSDNAVKFAYDVANYTIFDLYSTNQYIRLFDPCFDDLYKDIEKLCMQEIENVKDVNFFNKATFSISNKVYNTLINSVKYSRYYNIRRIVFSQCNVICNYYISSKLD